MPVCIIIMWSAVVILFHRNSHMPIDMHVHGLTFTKSCFKVYTKIRAIVALGNLFSKCRIIQAAKMLLSFI